VKFTKMTVARFRQCGYFIWEIEVLAYERGISWRFIHHQLNNTLDYLTTLSNYLLKIYHTVTW